MVDSDWQVVLHLRSSTCQRRDGSTVEYAQFAHNCRDPKTSRPEAEIQFNFGRREAVDMEVRRRLICSDAKLHGPGVELRLRENKRHMNRCGSRRAARGHCGCCGLWERPQIDTVLLELATSHRIQGAAWLEGPLVGIVMIRPLEPVSKHAPTPSLEKSAMVPSVPEDPYDEARFNSCRCAGYSESP